METRLRLSALEIALKEVLSAQTLALLKSAGMIMINAWKRCKEGKVLPGLIQTILAQFSTTRCSADHLLMLYLTWLQCAQPFPWDVISEHSGPLGFPRAIHMHHVLLLGFGRFSLPDLFSSPEVKKNYTFSRKYPTALPVEGFGEHWLVC